MARRHFSNPWMSGLGLGLKVLGEPGGCTGAAGTYVPGLCPCTTGMDTKGVGLGADTAQSLSVRSHRISTV